MTFSQALYDLAEETLALCRRAKRSIGTVESCTGGLLGALLTEVPGSSDIFIGGLITYANRVKTELASVPAEWLAQGGHGAVSREVAQAMAEGGRRRLLTDFAVALTGVAGPGGGTPEKPVGLVYIAVSGAEGYAEWARCAFTGDRTDIRLQAAETALRMLQQAVHAAAK